MSLRRPEEPRVAPRPDVLAKIDGKIAAANVVATFAHHRELSNRFADLFDFILFRGSTPRRQRELVILRMGWNCQSEYAFGQHTLYGRDAGLTEEEIGAVTRPLSTYRWAPADRVLLQMTDELHSDSCVTQETWDELADRWATPEILEFLCAALCYGAMAGVLNSLGVQLDGGVPGWPGS